MYDPAKQFPSFLSQENSVKATKDFLIFWALFQQNPSLSYTSKKGNIDLTPNVCSQNNNNLSNFSSKSMKFSSFYIYYV